MPMTMNRDIKDRWTTALRSGKYEQGRFKFERGGKFCCLGVLCDVMGEPTTIGSFGSGNWPLVSSLLGDSEIATTLALMNDQTHTFPQIADWIDAHIEEES